VIGLTQSNFVRRFSEIGIHDRSTAGGKGASLGELTGSGIRVPQGCVVTTAAFERFLLAADPQESIRREVEALSSTDLEGAARVSEKVRTQLEIAPMPPDLQAEISTHYDELQLPSRGTRNSEPVAIRSSATSEDGTDASFAGLQDTYLWVCGFDSVVAHVRKCWASLYTVESIVYRRRMHLPEQGLAMGVVIQCMIDARSSGVMFTRSPISGDRSVVVLEASWGLGSAVVSGEVTPDKYVVGKITGEIVSGTISTKLRMHRPNPSGSGVLDEQVPPDQQNAPCLADDEIGALVHIAKQVERHYGCPQDIEWAISRGGAPGENIFLLQSRPETAWAAKEAAPVATPKGKAFDHVFSLLSGGATRK
jgi:pyruvate,water dikinase